MRASACCIESLATACRLLRVRLPCHRREQDDDGMTLVTRDVMKRMPITMRNPARSRCNRHEVAGEARELLSSLPSSARPLHAPRNRAGAKLTRERPEGTECAAPAAALRVNLSCLVHPRRCIDSGASLDFSAVVLKYQHMTKRAERTPADDLSRRERQVMDILHRQRESTVAEIMQAMPDPPTYSAVRSILRILGEKKLISPQGRRAALRVLPRPADRKGP